jgi:hypothetical protein
VPFQAGSRVYQTLPTCVRLQAASTVPFREQRLTLLFWEDIPFSEWWE